MASGRWSQHDQDAERLPEGMQRIGYDADSSRYTFRDSEGNIYQSAPGSKYGTLTPVPNSTVEVLKSRPKAFATDKRKPKSHSLSAVDQLPATFYDFLPPNAVTSASLPESEKSSPPTPSTLTPRQRFVQAARKTALPKMQGIVHGLQRSITSARKASGHASRDAQRLLRTPRGSLNLERASSSATAWSYGSRTSPVMDVSSNH